MREPVLLAWSGGKDSALALRAVLARDIYRITLLTTLTEGYNRVSMHGVREELLDDQARSLGLPLEKVWIPPACPHEIYAARMEAALRKHLAQGCSRCFFGDLFLADVRAYREQNLGRLGMRAEFPLWGGDSRELAAAFLRDGFKAAIACVDGQALDGSFAGREYDRDFLADLPPGVDPCGENGEFHSFVYDGPIFTAPVRHRRGGVVLRDNRFFYCELLPQTP
ncbi:MAG: ATP-binding protein [Bacteroidota bacterium]